MGIERGRDQRHDGGSGQGEGVALEGSFKRYVAGMPLSQNVKLSLLNPPMSPRTIHARHALELILPTLSMTPLAAFHDDEL